MQRSQMNGKPRHGAIPKVEPVMSVGDIGNFYFKNAELTLVSTR